MPSQRLNRQYARLIKPTRNNAPTEYNAQFKRWNKTGRTKPQTAEAPEKRGKLVRPGRLQSANDPIRSHKLYHSRPWTTETDKDRVYKRTDPYTGDPTSAARWADQCNAANNSSPSKLASPGQYHSNAKPRNPPTATIIYDSDYEMKENRQGMPRQHSSRHSQKPKTARGVNDTNADANRAPKTDRTKHKSSAVKTPTKGEVAIDAEYILKYTSSIIPKSTQPEQVRKNCADSTKKGSSRQEKKRYRYAFPKEETSASKQTQVPKSTSTTPFMNKTKETVGIEERNLRKIYAHATDSELRRLMAALKSVGQVEKSPSKKQVSKVSVSDKPSEMSLSKEDLEKIRMAAYRFPSHMVRIQHTRSTFWVEGSVQVPKFCRKDVWSTTYNKAFCRKWNSDDYVSPYSGEFQPKKEVSECEFTNHYVAPELAKGRKKSEVSVVGNEEPDSDEESCCESNNGRSVTPSTEPGDSASVTELTVKKVEASNSERLLKDAQGIEEKEFQQLFNEDGRPRMKGETTSGMAHKGTQGPRYEDPVWANHTVVSLGSGHWNVLRDHYDGWDTVGKLDSNKKISEMVPKRSDGRSRKTMVYDQGEPGPTVKNPLSRDMVFGKYGGGGNPRRTHVSYVTEYMGKFTKMPMPRDKRRVV